MHTLATQLDPAKSLIDAYGPFAFGIVAVGFFAGLIVLLYKTIGVSMLEKWGRIAGERTTQEIERTKQHESLKASVESMERGQREIAKTAEIQKATLDGMQKLADRLGCHTE